MLPMLPMLPMLSRIVVMHNSWLYTRDAGVRLDRTSWFLSARFAAMGVEEEVHDDKTG